jgi:hypothetical protein
MRWAAETGLVLMERRVQQTGAGSKVRRGHRTVQHLGAATRRPANRTEVAHISLLRTTKAQVRVLVPNSVNGVLDCRPFSLRAGSIKRVHDFSIGSGQEAFGLKTIVWLQLLK